MATIPGLENINWGIFASKASVYATYTFIAILVFVIGWIILYFTSFKIKVTQFELYGSSKDGVFTFSKPTQNYVKWINNRTAWKSLFPLFNKKEREPFDSEFIYPGKRIFAFSLNDEWVPGRVNIDQTEDALRAEINPVPYYIRNWQSLQYQKHEVEFAAQGWWDQNKHIVLGIATVGICCVLCGLTIYYSYKFSTGGIEATQGLSNAIQGLANIAGQTPPPG